MSTLNMRKLMILLAGATVFASCSKMEELVPEAPKVDNTTEVHVYADRATYAIDVNFGAISKTAGDTTTQGVVVYRLEGDITYLSFRKTAGYRTSIKIKKAGKGMDLGYVDKVDPMYFRAMLD